MVDRIYKVAYGTAFRTQEITTLPETVIDEDIEAKNPDYVKLALTNPAEVALYFDTLRITLRIIDAGGYHHIPTVSLAAPETYTTPLTPPFKTIAGIFVNFVKAKADAPLGEVVYPKLSVEFRSEGAGGTIVWTEQYDGAVIVTPFDP
ncbi:MAG: hypothetical protein ACE5Z5_08025, partial [Candidatus Bathyarchaeia archaeon]